LNFIGLDVGFSKTRRSSGVACLSDGKLSVGCATASWESRAELLGDCTIAQVVAIDAPIVTVGNCEGRDCERVLTLGRFQRRCKPALSHVQGTGRQLRDAGDESVEQLWHVTSGCELSEKFPRVRADRNIIEAFPNAFLSVLSSTSDFDRRPKLSRGAKFDWVFEQCRQTNRISHVVNIIGLPGITEALPHIEGNANHDQRAALICLLTAACVAVGRYTAVGNQQGGYIFLPPWNAWALWAQEEIEIQRRRMDCLEVWINGKRFEPAEPLLPAPSSVRASQSAS